MTTDEQEALSFRYIAPRIFFLSSGNIAIIPMIGEAKPVIVESQNFYDLQSYIPDMQELEALERAQVRAQTRPATPKPPKATLDDLI